MCGSITPLPQISVEVHQALQPWTQSLVNLKAGSKVRWSLDVDPYDTY